MPGLKKRRAVVVIGIGLAAVSIGIFTLRPITSSPSAALIHPTTLPQQHKMSTLPSRPLQLVIPSLNVTAAVETKGLNDDGEMEAPQTGSAVSWYKFGYLPGALGNAVFAGHYTHEQQPAVFHKLPNLTKDQTIQIRTQEKQQTYTVTTVKTYNAGDTVENVFGSSKAAQIQLITCYGEWDATKHQYEKRLVVTATFTSEQDL